MSSGDKLSEKQGIQSKEVQGSNQGKAWLSTSMFRDRQPNEGLSDVLTSLRFEHRSRTSLAVDAFSKNNDYFSENDGLYTVIFSKIVVHSTKMLTF